jgi:DNA polymerase V
MIYSFALVDCNNFYVSCERLFNPRLIGKPVIVLSNNDGCVVALSDEAKKLGIKRGVPFFKIKPIIREYSVQVFSSNYELYGDISRRIMNIIKLLFPDVEIYSIDEAFIRLNSALDIKTKLAHASFIINRDTGIPVSFGYGKTKTLAKLANYIAKKYLREKNLYLFEEGSIDHILDKIDVSKIWGVGDKIAQKLYASGIMNASQLRKADYSAIKKQFNINVARTVIELNGTKCIELETITTRKNITVSRSFGKLLTNSDELETAISYYSAQACLKARNLALKPQAILVFLQTNFYSDSAKYSNSHVIKLDEPTNDTITINGISIRIIKKLFKIGFNYQKVGITLLDLMPANLSQGLLLYHSNVKHNALIMVALDKVNKKYGRNTVYLASQGTKKDWMMKRNYKSAEYTTNWNEIPLVG